jgi:hypothetical protein
MAAAGGGRRFFFRHVVSVCCRVRSHESAARAQLTKGPRKPWIAWRIWLLAWEKKVVESEGGAYRPGGPSLDCRLGTAGYAPGVGTAGYAPL